MKSFTSCYMYVVHWINEVVPYVVSGSRTDKNYSQKHCDKT
jgi:hypothetical protein